MSSNLGYAAIDASSPLGLRPFERRAVGPTDVLIDIKFCGVCHSDVHQARDEWGGGFATNYPCMPGHEIAGVVAEVGPEVTSYQVGDRVGVGCMVGSDGTCESCRNGEEQYCESGPTLTYNPKDDNGQVLFGGYSDQIVVPEHFVLRIPDSIPLENAAPMLCSAVTTYSPMKHWDIGAGAVLGVAGIGGLGHLAIKIAKARGARVVGLTREVDKVDDIHGFGADDVIVMADADDLASHAASLDFVLSTIPTAVDLKPYLSLLKRDGTLISVGMLEPLHAAAVDFGPVSMFRQSIAGSMIGSVAETQEILDFCAEHGIVSEIEIIPIDRINEAFDKIVANEVRYRYVIDNSTLRS